MSFEDSQPLARKAITKKKKKKNKHTHTQTQTQTQVKVAILETRKEVKKK